MFDTMTPASPVHAKKKRTGLKVAAAVVVGLVCFGVGAGSTSAQTVEVEKRVEVPVEKIVEKEVEVPVTPDSCTEAITLAEKALSLSSDSMGIMSEAMEAAGTFDVATMQGIPARLQPLTDQVKELTPDYQAAKASCLGATS